MTDRDEKSLTEQVHDLVQMLEHRSRQSDTMLNAVNADHAEKRALLRATALNAAMRLLTKELDPHLSMMNRDEFNRQLFELADTYLNWYLEGES